MSDTYTKKINGNLIAASEVVPSSPLETKINGKVSKSGDTMTGRLTLEKPISQVITGTGTAATTSGSGSSTLYYPALWKFNLGIATPTAGDKICIRIPVAGHDYGVFISTDNGTTYFPVARHTGKSRLGTQYPNGAYICVVFEGAASGITNSGCVDSCFPPAGATARQNYTSGCWRVINDYDSGNSVNQLRHENGRFYAGSTGCNPYSLICLDKDNKFSMLISSGSGTGTSKTINTSGKFKLSPVILFYNGNNTAAANARVSSTYATFNALTAIDTRYSHNHTTAFSVDSPLYIECTIDEDGFWSPTTKCITQTLESGKYYIFLGLTYSTEYQLCLVPYHPVYYYDGTNLTEVPRLSKADRTKLDRIASGATKVEASTTNGKIKINGTDTTVYTHPTHTAYSSKGSATKVPKITTDSTGHVTSIEEVTISGVTPASHSHGNIANGGTLTDTAAAAAGNDYVVIRDADNAKIQTSTIKGTDVADAVSKKHSHSTLTLSTTAQAYDGSHTLALPSTDPYTSARTPTSHTHGNITNGGALQTNDITIASGDKLVVTDADNSNKVARASISFDGSTTTTALTPKGTFEAFAKSGDITSAIQALDVGSVGGAGKYISAISETDGKISATATTMDTTPTANSTNAITSGAVKTALETKLNWMDGTFERSANTGNGWAKIASMSRTWTWTNLSGIWDVVYLATDMAYRSTLELTIRFDSTYGAKARRYNHIVTVDNSSQLKFAIYINGTNNTASTVELWAYLSNTWHGVGIREIGGDYYQPDNKPGWTYYNTSGGGGDKPTADVENNKQVVDFATTLLSNSTHTHGNITSAGALQTTDVAIASGDKLVITDSSDSNKVARASISFDGSTTTQALTPKGTFESFAKAGDITTAIQALDVSSVGGAGKYVSAISETDGKISATATTMDTAPTASSTNAVTSGGIKTALDNAVANINKRYPFGVRNNRTTSYGYRLFNVKFSTAQSATRVRISGNIVVGTTGDNEHISFDLVIANVNAVENNPSSINLITTSTRRGSRVVRLAYKRPSNWADGLDVFILWNAEGTATAANDTYGWEITQQESTLSSGVEVKDENLTSALTGFTLDTPRTAAITEGTSAIGSTSVPVYANENGVITPCNDDFVHDGDVTSTYSSTGTAPVNGTAVAAAIGGLDVDSVGGDGKYISAISETNGKISATATTMDTTPTASSTKAVTSGGIKTALDGKVKIANTSLEAQTTTLLAQVQAMAAAGTHYARFYTRTDGGSANISDKPESGSKGFVCEVVCKRYNNSSDYRYNLTCWVQGSSSPYVASVGNSTTGITWTKLSETNHTHTTSIAADSSSGTVVSLAHNTQYKLTTGGTSVLFKTPADTKVTQTKDDNGTTAYPLLMAGATDPNGTATTARYDSGVKLTPSTNTISANISGTADTAKNYDSSGGTIQSTFSSVNSSLQSLSGRVSSIENALGGYKIVVGSLGQDTDTIYFVKT